MGIMSILMAGMGSAILISTHALPNPANHEASIQGASDALDRLAEDLRTATWISDRSLNSIAFAVPDRDGDGLPERIRYEWSGTPGDALTRRYNQNIAIEVVADVHQFALAYETDRDTETYPGLPTESAPTMLASYTAPILSSEYGIGDDVWMGQCFDPTLPADAISWGVRSVGLSMRKQGVPTGEISVQLRESPGSGLPDAAVLEAVRRVETSLAAGLSWESFDFSLVAGITPDQGLCLVVADWQTGADQAILEYDASAGSGILRTATGDAGWVIDKARNLLYTITGTYLTPTPNATATHDYVQAVRVTLRSGDYSGNVVTTTVETLNRPEILTNFWRLDFDGDPTAVDMDDDAQGDWVCRLGMIFDVASLSGGSWTADSTLDTAPDNDFTELTTCEVRFHNTSVGGDGAVFTINVDWSGIENAPLIATLQLQADNSQTLTVYHRIDNATRERLFQATGLPDAMVKLRMLIDPVTDAVNVKVNGRDYGTQTYNRYSTMQNNRYASVYADGSSAEFDYVSVRVGGNNP